MAAEIELDRRLSNVYVQGRELSFTSSQTTKTYSVDHTGSERTQDAMDATSFILSLVEPTTKVTERDLVGELQLAFITGVHLGNDACMQQWWHMVLHLVLKAYRLVEVRPSLAEPFLRSVAWQLYYGTHHLETSLLEQSGTHSRDLRLGLIRYKQRLEELMSVSKNPAVLSVATDFARIESIVAAPPLDWDLRSDHYLRKGRVTMEDGEEVDIEITELEPEDERGEYGPQVVELDESGKEKGMVSWID